MLFKLIAGCVGSISHFKMLRFFAADLETTDETNAASQIVNDVMSIISQGDTSDDTSTGSSPSRGVELDLFVSTVTEDDRLWRCLQQISPFTPLVRTMETSKRRII